VDQASLRAAIAAGSLDRGGCEERDAVPGDVLLLRPGTLHAIGGGTFLYEIEQPSDITYRISDWGRPPVPGRRLHLAESVRAVDPVAHAEVVGSGWALDGGRLATGDFHLELLAPGGRAERRPAGRSLEVVTVVHGTATLEGDGWVLALERFGTVVVPAACERYRVDVSPGGRVCVGSLG
jgi:mannose-6-phosphate isomerase